MLKNMTKICEQVLPLCASLKQPQRPAAIPTLQKPLGEILRFNVKSVSQASFRPHEPIPLLIHVLSTSPEAEHQRLINTLPS